MPIGYIRSSSSVRIIGELSFVMLVLLTLTSVFPIVNHTEEAEASYTPANPPTLAITSSSTTASIEITPNSPNGTFATTDSANEIAFAVTTDNTTGYNLILSSTNDSDKLTNASLGDTIDSISSITTASDFATGAVSTYANKWGLKPSKYNSLDNTSYVPAPTTTEISLDTTNTSNPTIANNYTIGIGARVDYEKYVGTYTNTFIIQAVGNQISYQINYLDNSSGTDVSVLPSEGASDVAASAFILSSAIPTRTNYDFKGWCYGTVSHATNPSSCTGIVYQPSGTFNFSSASTASTNIANLYAMWEFAGVPLYNQVASMSKGTQTAAELQATITVPTSADRTLDTSNSGVYEYDSSVFGVATDAANDYKIYYYRGILNTSDHTGTYGSDGLANTYPNYVILGSTCWRILRTTGSGGIKMVYNGLYGATTANSCANNQANAQLPSTSTFNGNDNMVRQAVRLGYTYNNDYASNTNIYMQAGILFGTNSNHSGNTASSDIKTTIENWYDSYLASYTSRLESSAGYCGDRTLYSTNNALKAETTEIAQYSTGTTSYDFGAYVRNRTTSQTPTLSCATYDTVDRSTVDLYTTSSASDGNKQLTRPIALLTADEASFAGSGSSTASQGSNYHSNSYLATGSSFWLLSPAYRHAYGYAQVFVLWERGDLGNNNTSYAYGVRPVISLSPDAKIVSGFGTSTSPWQVTW